MKKKIEITRMAQPQSFARRVSWNPRLSYNKARASLDKKAEGGQEPYEPYSERSVEHPTTNFETFLHHLKGSVGTGILAMPKAFYNSGWVIGLFGTIIIGWVCTICIEKLVRTEYEVCRRRKIPALNYPLTAKAALLEGPPFLQKASPYSGFVVNMFVLLYQLGICCIYVIFIATNVRDLVGYFWHPVVIINNETVVGNDNLDLRIYMAIILVPLILLNFVRNLKYLVPFSMIANFILLFSFAVILYYIFDYLPNLSHRTPVGDVQNWPLFMGTVLFSLEAIGVIMPLENEMETPKSFFIVIRIGMSAIVALYAAIGFFGYWKYGDSVAPTIPQNLPNDWLGLTVKASIAVAIYFTYPIQCYVAIDIIWNGTVLPYFEESKFKILYELLTRSLIVTFTVLLAALIPHIDLFIPLVGALTLTSLGLAFPAILEQATWWYHLEKKEFIIMSIKNTLIILFGVLGFFIGVTTAIIDIVIKFSEKSS